jgi:transposase-like protein
MSKDTVAACPSCGSSNIRTRSPGKPAQRSHVHDEQRHYCRDCQTPTDTLDRRPKRTPGARHGMAETLAKLDAADVPALSGGDS